MALPNFSATNSVLDVNLKELTDFGNTNPAVTFEYIDQKSTLRRGIGGRGTRFDSINPGIRVTINLNPGGSDSAAMSSFMEQKADITLTHEVIGTLEKYVLTDGVIVNMGQTGRYGDGYSDDQYIIEFNTDVITRGGES